MHIDRWGLAAISAALGSMLLVAAAALLDAAESNARPDKARTDKAWTVKPPDPSAEPEEADNSYCVVCHIDLEREELVRTHQPGGVGCETCHGLSDEHSADEDGLTAPQIMWPTDRIVSRCMTCHPQDTLLAEGNEGAEDHRPFLDRLAAADENAKGEKYCTECHGDHRIRNRTRTWDKENGKLLQRSGGPTMDTKAAPG